MTAVITSVEIDPQRKRGRSYIRDHIVRYGMTGAQMGEA
jgi:hypothetical protein